MTYREWEFIQILESENNPAALEAWFALSQEQRELYFCMEDRYNKAFAQKAKEEE